MTWLRKTSVGRYPAVRACCRSVCTRVADREFDSSHSESVEICVFKHVSSSHKKKSIIEISLIMDGFSSNL